MSAPLPDLEALGGLTTPELRAQWLALFRHPSPPRLKRDLLIRAIAHRLQENRFGGLRPATRRRLERLAAGKAPRPVSVAALRPGLRLMREWNGETHLVEVTAEGIRWCGQTYKSLSAVARVITGARWSGPCFFGLLDKPLGRKG